MTVKVDNKGRNISRLVIVSGKQFFDEKKESLFSIIAARKSLMTLLTMSNKVFCFCSEFRSEKRRSHLLIEGVFGSKE